MRIMENYSRIREEVPREVTIVAAAKFRTAEEISELIDAGATDIGENYVQEAVAMHEALGDKAQQLRWHLIGHLQKNKINKALPVIDVIQTVDSYRNAEAIDRRAVTAGKAIVPIYVEVNIGNEDTKSGIKPEEHEPFEPYLEQLVQEIATLDHVRVDGLMTMGPRFGDPERVRPHFRRLRRLFDRINQGEMSGVHLRELSMGMTGSYRVAIEEGSTMVRIGTALFGDRPAAAQRPPTNTLRSR